VFEQERTKIKNALGSSLWPLSMWQHRKIWRETQIWAAVHEWYLAHRAFLKDFAGPLATLFAALVAAIITAAFGYVQFVLARSRRDIALDKLKFDLYEKRYQVYVITKTMLEYQLGIRDAGELTPEKIEELVVSMNQARFISRKAFRSI
jgi:hypothetical protein